MPTIHPKDENPYILDAESAAEMTRLLQQDQLLTKGMGALLPAQIDPAQIHDVLDIGCGPGGWVRDVAFTYPEMEVTGFDLASRTVEYAQAMAKAQRLDNAHYVVMDALKPLGFPDNSFDFVNGRFLFGFMSKTTWPQLVKECIRILRPGGFLRLTEAEVPMGTSLAAEKLYHKLAEAMSKGGRTFSPDGRLVGVIPVIGALLREAGFQQVQHTAHILECSAGQDAWHSFYQDFKIGVARGEPFLLKAGVISKEEYDAAYQQALADILSDDFCGIWLYASVVGQKPAG